MSKISKPNILLTYNNIQLINLISMNAISLEIMMEKDSLMLQSKLFQRVAPL